jgi:tetratricopeptide (TPR) repeat protein
MNSTVISTLLMLMAVCRPSSHARVSQKAPGTSPTTSIAYDANSVDEIRDMMKELIERTAGRSEKEETRQSDLDAVSRVSESFGWFLTGLAVFVSVGSLIVGIIIAINVWAGRKDLELAREEINRVGELRKEYEEKIGAFDAALRDKRDKAIQEIDESVKRAALRIYDIAEIRRIKSDLLNELVSRHPDAESVFKKLGNILEYPNRTSLEIYEKCLRAFPNDREIVKKVAQGLQIFHESEASIA